MFIYLHKIVLRRFALQRVSLGVRNLKQPALSADCSEYFSVIKSSTLKHFYVFCLTDAACSIGSQTVVIPTRTSVAVNIRNMLRLPVQINQI